MHCDAKEGSMCTSGRRQYLHIRCPMRMIHEVAAALQGFSDSQPHAFGRHQAFHYTESCRQRVTCQ